MPSLTKEQLQAVNHENGNILISASAGSGKTHTMIERIKRIMLQKDVSVSQILCVTFTEKAAFEMKEKLKNALKDNFDSNDKKRLMKELVELSTADVSTLHSFCGKLIRNYFFLVGVAPDFQIADETQAKVMREECIDKTMREAYDSGETWFYNLIERHESARSDNKLRQLILSIYNFYNSEPNPELAMQEHLNSLKTTDIKGFLAQYKGFLNEQLSAFIEQTYECLQVFTSYSLVKASAFCSSLIKDLNELLQSKNVYDVKKYQDYALKLDFERNLEPVCEYYKQTVKEIRDKFKKLAQKYAKHLTDKQTDLIKIEQTTQHVEGLLKLVKRFSKLYAQEKMQENLLDFNDLEHFALEILSDEQTKQSVREKYKYVFVDEYQDINGVQEQIINLVSCDNLFMVGDVKQSIYGFRGCRPEFFSNKFDEMLLNGQAVVTLNHNFRSASSVINLVNSIFDYCMTKQYFGYDYKSTSRLIAGADWATAEKGRAQVHFYKKPPKEKKKSEKPELYDILKRIDVVEDEKDGVHHLVTKIINDELTKTYYDFKEQVYKPVTLGDIVVLTRGKNTAYVGELVKGLNRHGFSVSSDVRENACDFPEISMMVNALKLIDCFEQNVALASVMKSPIGNFTNEQFVEIIRFYEESEPVDYDWTFVDAYKYYLDKANTLLNKKLKVFDEYFAEVRTLADFLGAKGILEKLIKENNVEAYLLAQSMGSSKVNRLNKFLASAVSGAKKLTVKEFLYKIENSPQSFEFADQLSQEDTVKVMTIHASKGLEFPVVILCGLECAFNSEEEWGDIIYSRKHGLACCFYDDEKRVKEETLIRGIIKQDLRRERIREEMRLFYVATTRAMFSLHLTFEGKKDERKNKFYGADKFLDYLPSYLTATEHDENEFKFMANRLDTRKVLIGNADTIILEQIKSNLAFKYAYEQDTVLPLKTNVTASLKIANEEQPLTYVLFDEPSPNTEKGNIAHKILEYYNFNGAHALSEQVESIIDAKILTKEQVNKVNLSRIENALKCSVFDVIGHCKLYREKPFIVSVEANKVVQTNSTEPVIVQGVIDLLAINGEKALVFDYKYSSLDDESLKIKYAKQLDLYSYAVEKILGKKVIKKIIVNLFTGSTVEIG